MKQMNWKFTLKTLFLSKGGVTRESKLSRVLSSVPSDDVSRERNSRRNGSLRLRYDQRAGENSLTRASELLLILRERTWRRSISCL